MPKNSTRSFKYVWNMQKPHESPYMTAATSLLNTYLSVQDMYISLTVYILNTSMHSPNENILSSKMKTF
jgi:hypothetical protein